MLRRRRWRRGRGEKASAAVSLRGGGGVVLGRGEALLQQVTVVVVRWPRRMRRRRRTGGGGGEGGQGQEGVAGRVLRRWRGRVEESCQLVGQERGAQGARLGGGYTAAQLGGVTGRGRCRGPEVGRVFNRVPGLVEE